jgi:hypothetical protein
MHISTVYLVWQECFRSHYKVSFIFNSTNYICVCYLNILLHYVNAKRRKWAATAEWVVITFHISGLCYKSANVERVGNDAATLRVTFRIIDCALFHSILCFIVFSEAGRMGQYSKVPYSIKGKGGLLKYAPSSASCSLEIGGITSYFMCCHFNCWWNFAQLLNPFCTCFHIQVMSHV